MALGQAGRIAIPMSIIGILSFILGVIAENKKPALGEVITLKDGVVCKFPSDPTVALGSTSFLLFLFSTMFGLVAVFHPYKGKSFPAQSSSTHLPFATSIGFSSSKCLAWQLPITCDAEIDKYSSCVLGQIGKVLGSTFLSYYIKTP